TTVTTPVIARRRSCLLRDATRLRAKPYPRRQLHRRLGLRRRPRVTRQRRGRRLPLDGRQQRPQRAVRRLGEVHPRDRAVDERVPRHRLVGDRDLPQDGREQRRRRRVGRAGQDLDDRRLVEAVRVLLAWIGRDEQLRQRVHLVLVMADLAERLGQVPVAQQQAPYLRGAVAALLFLQVLQCRVTEQAPVLLPVPGAPRGLADQTERVHLLGTEPLGQLPHVLGRVHDRLDPRVGQRQPLHRVEQRPVRRGVRRLAQAVLDLAQRLGGDRSAERQRDERVVEPCFVLAELVVGPEQFEPGDQ